MKRLDRRNLSIAGAIGLAHVVVVGLLGFSQGCRTPAPTPSVVEPPPAPVMPPPAVPEATPAPAPVLPPPAVEAPAPQRPSLPPPREYTVQAGDSLSKIAVKFGVTTRELMELNNIKDPNKIRAGQKLILPSYAAETPKPVKTSRPKPASTPAGASEYVVQKGDTLSGIAQKLGTTTRALIEANHIENPNSIRAGQKLVVPAGVSKKEVAQPAKAEASTPPTPPPPPAVPETPPVTPAAAPMTPAAPAMQPSAPASTPSLGAGQTIRYPVGPGETLDSIAKTFLVTPEAILKANDLPDASAIKPGMTIQIPLGP